jgi:hypothetical protein
MASPDKSDDRPPVVYFVAYYTGSTEHEGTETNGTLGVYATKQQAFDSVPAGYEISEKGLWHNQIRPGTYAVFEIEMGGPHYNTYTTVSP